jgi:hypothetical protein
MAFDPEPSGTDDVGGTVVPAPCELHAASNRTAANRPHDLRDTLTGKVLQKRPDGPVFKVYEKTGGAT